MNDNLILYYDFFLGMFRWVVYIGGAFIVLGIIIKGLIWVRKL